MSKDAYIICGTHCIPLGIISGAAQTLTCILEEYNKGEHFQMSRGFRTVKSLHRHSQTTDQRILNYLNLKIITGFRELIQNDQYPDL